MNVLRVFQSHVWAIVPQSLFEIEAIIHKKIDGNLDSQIVNDLKNRNKELNAKLFISSDLKQGFPSPDATTEEGLTAVIPIKGSMFKYATFFSDVSGARSMEQIGKDIRQADADPRISNIILDWDTPGGTVDGTETLSNIVATTKKPLLSFVNGRLCSAGVWGACHSPHIMASGKTAEIGSIGVLTWHTDETGWQTQTGIKETPITATQSKDKLIAPHTSPMNEHTMATIRKEYLDPVADMFISTVKEGLKDSLTTTEDVFTGKIYYGEDALKHGLIHSIGTFEDALAKGRQQVFESSKIVINKTANMEFPKLKALFGSKEATMKEDEAHTIEAALAGMVPVADLDAVKAERDAVKTQLAEAKTTIDSQAKEIERLKAEDAATGSHVGKKDDKEITDFAKQSAQYSHNVAADSNPLIEK